MNITRVSCLMPAYLFAACLLLVCGGCTQTEVEEGRGVDGEEMEVQINLSVLPENAPRTRSLTFTTKGCTETDSLQATVGAATPITRAEGLSEVEEETLNHLCVVQFNSRGAQVGSPIFLPSLDGAVADGTTTLKVIIKKSPGINTLYFLANAGDLTEVIYGKNEAGFKKMLQTIAFTDAGMLQDSRCAMVGSWKGEATDETKSVALTRAVAKINFSYSVESGTNDFSFTPTRLRLCNVPRQIYYVSSGTQPAAVEYTSYTAPDFGTAASWCWYLPENQAGAAEGEGIATSDKEKTGVGVNNATYIELTGDVVQGTDLYPGVVFRLYPGSAETDGYNDYNVNRNTSYTINITLTGIDFADKRVTVGKIPAMANPDTLGVKKDATVSFRILAQPSKPGSFTLPDWLSAEIDGNTFGAEATVSYNNPMDVVFSAVSTNSSDDPRDFAFATDMTLITVTQEGFVFPSSLPNLLLLTKGTAMKLSIKASDGVNWTVERVNGDESITFTPSSGTGTQDVTFAAPVNVITGSARLANFVVKTVDSEPERTCDITVRQEPAMLPGSFYETSSHQYQVAPLYTEITTDWESAKRYCANLSADGFEKGSWILPTSSDLCYISVGNYYVYKNNSNYKMPFGMYYWSSTEKDAKTAYREYLINTPNLPTGQTSAYDKTYNLKVRCVRTVYKYN